MNGTNRIPQTDPQDLGTAEGHPTLEALDAYHQGSLPAKEAGQVQHHLLFCRGCRDLLLDLARFLADSDKPSRLWSAELTSAWEEWRAELGRRESRNP
ncbi:MAG TPA: zf-HC2 domain-containing protein [Thermoanaerobaculia bacterium]|nr:zf-HC2 domain-containing protein [Thermoanaerobaculia bacterium]